MARDPLVIPRGRGDSLTVNQSKVPAQDLSVPGNFSKDIALRGQVPPNSKKSLYPPPLDFKNKDAIEEVVHQIVNSKDVQSAINFAYRKVNGSLLNSEQRGERVDQALKKMGLPKLQTWVDAARAGKSIEDVLAKPKNLLKEPAPAKPITTDTPVRDRRTTITDIRAVVKKPGAEPAVPPAAPKVQAKVDFENVLEKTFEPFKKILGEEKGLSPKGLAVLSKAVSDLPVALKEQMGIEVPEGMPERLTKFGELLERVAKEPSNPLLIAGTITSAKDLVTRFKGMIQSPEFKEKAGLTPEGIQKADRLLTVMEGQLDAFGVLGKVEQVKKFAKNAADNNLKNSAGKNLLPESLSKTIGELSEVFARLEPAPFETAVQAEAMLKTKSFLKEMGDFLRSPGTEDELNKLGFTPQETRSAAAKIAHFSTILDNPERAADVIKTLLASGEDIEEFTKIDDLFDKLDKLFPEKVNP